VLPVFEDPGNCETDVSTVTDGEKNKAVAKLGDQMARATTVVHTRLTKLYIFCDKIGDVTAKQALLGSFVEECTETRATGKSYHPNSTHVSWVYSGTFPSDPLRVYLVDCYAYMGLSTWVGPNHNYQSFPQEFMFDLLAKIYKVRAKPNNSSKLKDTKYYLDKLAEYENKGEDTDSGMEVG
jgi:hypothetical protein